ncbi:MAG: type IV pilus assembly protein PilV [Janthinobacterium sp.]|jgi:type IV pilus assembly protein PilV
MTPLSILSLRRLPRPEHALLRQRGTTLLEVLITMIILAFGLLGIAVFQIKAQAGASESYQRAQAIVLLENMHARIKGNAQHASDYVLGQPVGSGDAAIANCGVAAPDAAAPDAAFDVCEWRQALQGAAELKAGVSVGAMQGARGCIIEVQAPDASGGVCRHGIYLISVAWQGLHKTRSPALDCGRNLYGEDGNRRVIALRIAVGLPSCS